MNAQRSYTMRTRAAQVEDTRRRILQATFDLSADRLVSDIRLDAVAKRAGVSVQTVLRQFGSRAGLVTATSEYAAPLVAAERRTTPGDVDGGLQLLLDHYEQRGDATLMLLSQEASDPLVGGVVARGRRVHRSWVEETFAPLLARVPADLRAESTDLLVVATDVYTWKLLRRDQGLGREATRARMRALVTAILAGLPPDAPSGKAT